VAAVGLSLLGVEDGYVIEETVAVELLDLLASEDFRVLVGTRVELEIPLHAAHVLLIGDDCKRRWLSHGAFLCGLGESQTVRFRLSGRRYLVSLYDLQIAAGNNVVESKCAAEGTSLLSNVHGPNEVDPHARIAEESPTTLTVTPMAGGVRLDYTWSYKGLPQQGSILFTLESSTVNAPWTDTWHTGNKPMACSGISPDTMRSKSVYLHRCQMPGYSP